MSESSLTHVCPQMNCVLCNVELPIYDHFPLIDGTMFMSPEKNEQSTKYSFKVSIFRALAQLELIPIPEIINCVITVFSG